MFLAFSPCAFRRACVAVRKSRVIDSWQVSQLSEPTNSAPGMLGGARIVRFVSNVLQESRITVSAAVPPMAHNSFSRLPWIHRVSLECHMSSECCQKDGTATTHFYGKSLCFNQRPDFLMGRVFERLRTAVRNSVGDFPESFLKARLNCESD